MIGTSVNKKDPIIQALLLFKGEMMVETVEIDRSRKIQVIGPRA